SSSSQDVPSAFGCTTQRSCTSSHTPSRHWVCVASEQSRGPPEHLPAWQRSFSVQYRPSSHAEPSFSRNWQDAEQPPPSVLLPSSHASPLSTRPSPQRATRKAATAPSTKSVAYTVEPSGLTRTAWAPARPSTPPT